MEENEYNLLAKQALDDLNVTYHIILLGKRKNKLWGDDYERNCYIVKLFNSVGESESFKFWDSICNTKNDKKMSLYDFLACVTKDNVGDYYDFCWDFGYDANDISSKKVYHEVEKEYEKMKNLFTDDALQFLAETFV